MRPFLFKEKEKANKNIKIMRGEGGVKYVVMIGGRVSQV